MKFSGADSEVCAESLLGWTTGGADLLMDTHKLVMDPEEDAAKATMDALDSFLHSPPSASAAASAGGSFAELKPLPPFTGYTGHLSINGISGHHYHTIAAGPPSPQAATASLVETNNNSAHATNQNTAYKAQNNNGGTAATLFYTISTTSDQPVVSSSTVDNGVTSVKPEFIDYSNLLASPDIEDIAAIIGSAIADTTTVPQNVDPLAAQAEEAAGSRDSWMDIDAWIDTACSSGEANSSQQQQQQQQQHQQAKNLINADNLPEFVATTQFVVAPSAESAATSTLQNLLTQSGYPLQPLLKREPGAGSYHMPLLQSRLQNGVKTEPSSYLSECTSPSSSTPYLAHSPPGHVVSTTDTSLLLNGRYRPVNGLGAFAGSPSKSKSRNRSNRKAPCSAYSPDGGAASLLGKEKPVHRCSICNRGFLNKSNIKVHLRTHTGEKPFRCEVCGKAFRQKAHLIKHQQIHKRVGRD